MNKIACVFLKLSNNGSKNYLDTDFFSYNAINSFKKWHPDIEIHLITDDNFNLYLTQLSIDEYYDNVGLVRVHIIKELMKQHGYTKVIMLGLDTFTCSYLDEFINDTESDLICSSGPPYTFLSTQYYKIPTLEFEYNGVKYRDVPFINADVTCFNSLKAAELVYEMSIKHWTDHAEQGGLNYCYINQNDLNIKVKIVDFPYITAASLYNVRSKGTACGGNQMYRNNVYNGNYKDPSSRIIGNIYPTSTYFIKDDKLYTTDNKQIKVFHYAEALGFKTKDEYVEFLDEIRTMWFNKETINFLTNKCNCKF